jgi:ribosome-associated protein
MCCQVPSTDSISSFLIKIILMTSTKLAKRIAELALEKKALDVKILDLRALDAFTDYFVICSGEVEIQIKAIADHIQDTLASEKIKPFHQEGYENLEWILIDYVDVVVHVFLPDRRQFYGLESLWMDAKIKEVSDQPKPTKPKRKKTPTCPKIK